MWLRRKRHGVLFAPTDDISIGLLFLYLFFQACSAVGQREIQEKTCLVGGNVCFVFQSSGNEQ